MNISYIKMTVVGRYVHIYVCMYHGFELEEELYGSSLNQAVVVWQHHTYLVVSRASKPSSMPSRGSDFEFLIDCEL